MDAVNVVYWEQTSDNSLAALKAELEKQPSETEAALWALSIGEWDVQRVSLYDEEGVEGWRWTGPTSVEGHAEIGDWSELPPVPDVVMDAYDRWRP